MPYQLKHPTSSTPTLIVLCYRFNGRKINMSTGQKIHPDNWNAITHRPRKNGSDTLTILLDRMESRVKELHLKLQSDGIVVTPELLKRTIRRDIETGGKKEIFMEFAARLIKECKRPSMKLTYQNTYNILKSYPVIKDFADITPAWLSDFQQSMEIDDYSANYIGLAITIIKQWMGMARKQGLHRNDSYRDYKAPSEVAQTIYLTQDELLAIHRAELPGTLDRTRARFLLAAFSGLRYSDSSRITYDDIHDGMIYNRNIKTGTQIVVPVHPIIQEIIDRYPDGLPKPLSCKQVNQNLKKIGELAGINTPTVVNKVRGGAVVTETVPKWKLICSHSGRRSCVTNMLMAGIPAANVMSVTGHKTQAAFSRYCRIGAQENAVKLKEHEFFNQGNKKLLFKNISEIIFPQL